MNNLERFYKEQNTITGFSKAYFSYLSGLLSKLDENDIKDFLAVLEETRRSGRTIFVAGNGGSASTASHMGTDFGCAGMKPKSKEAPFRTQPLTDHISMITAAGNDYGYEYIFTKQLDVHYRNGDVLIVISASGNSPNVVEAAKWVREKGGKVLGLLGFDGGKLNDLCGVTIVVKTPKGEYGPVEDTHLILNHMFTAWMQYSFADRA